jgi:hypothetical protein
LASPDALFRSPEERNLRDRLQIVLMAHRGRAVLAGPQRPGRDLIRRTPQGHVLMPR